MFDLHEVHLRQTDDLQMHNEELQQKLVCALHLHQTLPWVLGRHPPHTVSRFKGHRLLGDPVRLPDGRDLVC